MVGKDLIMATLFGSGGGSSGSGGGGSGGGGGSPSGEYVTGQFTLAENTTTEYAVQTDGASLGVACTLLNVLVLDTTELTTDKYPGAALFAVLRRSDSGTSFSCRAGYDTSQYKGSVTNSGLSYTSDYVMLLTFASGIGSKGLAGHTYTYWIWRAV